MPSLPATPVSAELAMHQVQARAQEPKDKAAAKEFEAMFMSEMFNHMFEGVDTDPLFGGGGGEKMFRSMLIQEYGKTMAKGKGIGISDQIQKFMLQTQEKAKGL
ncbi:MAG: rod-binding protein [Alphaproteobacteria bacterium]